MVAAAIRRARMRELACLGRSRPARAGGARSGRPSAACAQALTDATSIGEGLITRPRATTSRPKTDRLMAATI